MNSKELAFTWLSRCCYGREARQRRKKPLSLRLSHIPIFSLSGSLSLLLCSLSLPESLAGWKTKWLMRVHSSRSPSLHFSNNIHSLFHFSSLKHLSLLPSSAHLSFSFCLSPSFSLCFSLTLSLSVCLSVISESQPVSHAPTAHGQAEYASVCFRPFECYQELKSRHI